MGMRSPAFSKAIGKTEGAGKKVKMFNSVPSFPLAHAMNIGRIEERVGLHLAREKSPNFPAIGDASLY